MKLGSDFTGFAGVKIADGRNGTDPNQPSVLEGREETVGDQDHGIRPAAQAM